MASSCLLYTSQVTVHIPTINGKAVAAFYQDVLCAKFCKAPCEIRYQSTQMAADRNSIRFIFPQHSAKFARVCRSSCLLYTSRCVYETAI